MIGLSVEGKKIVLPPKQAIRYEENNDVLDFDSSGSSFSWPFSVSTEANAEALGFPNAIDGNQNAFAERDAALCLDGNVWKEGKLSVQESDAAKTKTILRSNISVYDKYKDTLISELITSQISMRTRDPAVELPLFNADKISPVVFPLIIKQRLEDFDKGTGLNKSFVANDSVNPSTIFPCFKMKYVLAEIFKTIGAEFHDEISSDVNDFDRWILFGNTGFWLYQTENLLPVNLDVSYYLPEITLGDLLDSIRGLAASNLKVDNYNKIIKISSINRLFNKPIIKELTKVVGTNLKIEPIKKKNISISFDSSDDLFVNTDELEGVYKGVVDSTAELPLNFLSIYAGDYFFCKLENSYYKYFYDEIALEHYWKFYKTPFQPLKNDDSISITSKLIPVHKRNYKLMLNKQFIEEGGTITDLKLTITDNGSGKVRLTSSVYRNDFDRGFNIVGCWMKNISIDGHSEIRMNTITAIASDKSWFDIDVDWIKNGECDVWYKDEFPYYALATAGELNFLDNDEDRSGNEARIAIYHGITTFNYDSVNYQHPYASCDPLDGNGNKIGNEAIRFHQDNNIITTYWKSVLKFMSETRIIKGHFYMNINDLLSFKILTKVRIKGVTMLLRKLKSIHTTDGVKQQDFEGYRL